MLNFDHFLFLEVVILIDTISNFFAGHYDFKCYYKKYCCLGGVFAHYFVGPTLTGLLYKWMAPPCNLLLTEEKTKLPDKCLGECMLEILTETLIKLSVTSIILSPLRIAHPCTSSKTQSP